MHLITQEFQNVVMCFSTLILKLFEFFSETILLKKCDKNIHDGWYFRKMNV